MNEDIKERWVEALRSGDYQQTKGSLIVQEGEQKLYCCLGVLTDLAMKEGIEGVRFVEGVRFDSETELSVRLDDERWVTHDEGDLPLPVMEWAGLPSRDPALGSFSAIHWNDDAGSGFDEIADMIEEHL